MDALYSIHNFEDESGCRMINSPRSLESCLRCGLDPSELLPQSRKAFVKGNLTEDMIDIAYDKYENKRQDKINLVKIEYSRILGLSGGLNTPGSPGAQAAASHAARLKEEATARSNAAMEAEVKRMEALKRRQEDEINKMIEKETQQIELQKKIHRAEEEDLKRKKEHEKNVAAAKLENQKKVIARLKERADREAEEAIRKKEIQKKEKEFEAKMAAVKAEEDARIAAEAKLRDAERAAKVEAKKKKSQAAIEAQFKLAETTRQIMQEREERVRAAMAEKKEIKRKEVAEARAAAALRIASATEKFKGIHAAKKSAFHERQASAEVRAKEKAVEDREHYKKQAEVRERKIAVRQKRLEDAFRNRAEHRASVIARRTEKDKTFGVVSAVRDEQNALKKFNQDLKLLDKRENVERIARVNEFKRLQTLKKIEKGDIKMLKIKAEKNALLQKHRDESKASLTRKHAITDAMEQMRMTNDFSKLDQLFKKKPEKKDKGDDDDEPETAKKA